MTDTPVENTDDFDDDEGIFDPDYEPSTETAPLEDSEKVDDPDEEEHANIPERRYGGPFLNEIEEEQRKSRVFAQDEPTQEDPNV